MTVALRRHRPVCAGCGHHGRGVQIHEHRVKRWRHLDLGSCRCIIECPLRRLRCAVCGRDGFEHVEFARPDAPYTRDFEDLGAWLAQHTDKTSVVRLLRIGWASIGKIIARVVADCLDADRLANLVLIGVDEICWAADKRFLTCVADHQHGQVVWAAPGRNAATLAAFFAELGVANGRSRRSAST